MVQRKTNSGSMNLRIEALENRELLAADLMQSPPPPPEVQRGPAPPPPSETSSATEGPRRGRGNLNAQPGILATGQLNAGPEFASVDGSGNNLEHSAWGSVGQALERWTEVSYADGISEPSGEDRPSARLISNIVAATPGDIANSKGLSDLAWLFGQFIDHDIDLSESGDEAFDIEVPTGDPWFDPTGTGEATISLNRTHYLEHTHDGVRQQFNEITAFIDGSVIYGSDQERADALRSFEGGRLATSDGDLLPFNSAGLANAGGTSETFFLAGDVRANENAALMSMHTLWVREHNRVADRISEDNPQLSDEEVYQRARQFVTAELQSITYNEFLPALLGENAISDYRGYDANVNPNIANVFSTAAYRFGHSMLSSELQRLNNDGTIIDEGNLALLDAFFNVGAVADNGIDSLLLGASVQTAQEVDPFVVDDIRNFLFGPPGAGGFDLASLNIQRGRDHGLADYNQIRIDMGLDPVESFADISSDIEIQSRLAGAYGDVNSIDPWVGMLAEDHLPGSTLGATATTIIAEQFQRLRDGDRFYFENVFEGRQLNRLRNTTFADVMERNTDINFRGNANVFFAGDAGIATDNSNGPPPAPNPGSGDPVMPPPPPQEGGRRQVPRPTNPAIVDAVFAGVDDDDDLDRAQLRAGNLQ